MFDSCVSTHYLLHYWHLFEVAGLLFFINLWSFWSNLCFITYLLLVLLLQCPSGVLVHPSGIEKLLGDCVNAFRTCYGDQQGKSYRVWVDQVLPTQVGSDSWLVKYKKWELSGEDFFSS